MDKKSLSNHPKAVSSRKYRAIAKAKKQGDSTASAITRNKQSAAAKARWAKWRKDRATGRIGPLHSGAKTANKRKTRRSASTGPMPRNPVVQAPVVINYCPCCGANIKHVSDALAFASGEYN